jgi:hypothetical protein
MPVWGANDWLNVPPLFDAGAGDTGGPVFALLSPGHGLPSVAPDAPIRICVYGTGGTPSTEVRVRGVLVYDDGIVSDDYAGFGKEFAGRLFIELVRRTPFAPSTPVTVHVTATHATNFVVTTTSWAYTIAQETGYTGNELLTEEAWLLTPMQRFLDLEPLRLFMLSNVLVPEKGYVANASNVAARAIYQYAYESEVSSALNPFMRRNESALETRIPTRRSVLELSTALDAYERSYATGMAQLFASGAFPREFRNNFSDYFESLLYNYRVSAVCALLLLARAIEVADTNTP